VIPIKIVIKNFASHVRSILDFTKFDVALLVGVCSDNPDISNATGKSSIFYAIRWCLFGKSEFSTNEKVVRRKSSLCSVSFEFSIGDNIYKTLRRFNRKSSTTNILFCKKVGDKWDSNGLTCSTSTATNHKIVELIKMNDDTLVNSVYFRQNDISGFASANMSKRKGILKDILQIGIWDKFQVVAKDKEKKLCMRREIIDDRLKMIGDIEAVKKRNEDEISIMKANIDNKKKELSKLEEKLSTCIQSISRLEVLATSKDSISTLNKRLDVVSRKIKKVNSKCKQLQDNIKKNNSAIGNASKDCSILEEKLVELSKKVLLASCVDQTKAKSILNKIGDKETIVSKCSQEDIDQKIKEFERLSGILNNFKQDLYNLNVLSPNSECPTCLTKIDNPSIVSKQRTKRRELLEFKIKETKDAITQVSADIDYRRGIINDANRSLLGIERTELTISKRMAVHSESMHSNEILQIDLENLNEMLKTLEEEHRQVELTLHGAIQTELLLNGDTNSITLDQEIELRDSIINLVDNIKREILELSIRHGNLIGQMSEVECKVSEKMTLLLQREELSSDIEVYSNLTKSFGRNGIQSIIVENITEDLRGYTNSILKHICTIPISVDFATQRYTSSGSWKEQFDIKIHIDNDVLDFNDLSGGEQVRVSIALRLALSNVLMKRVGCNVKFLLLDEVDQALDKSGIDALAETIRLLSTELKILVITHNETMKGKFDNIITIRKDERGSVLNQ
jgi:DNA repair exonuclease SbcCD ATPase subunit